MSLPKSQGELIRTARGELSQSAFARELGVDRTCLCRYESEVLGAPASVINRSLTLIASRLSTGLDTSDSDPLRNALEAARRLVRELERAIESDTKPGRTGK